MQEAGANPGRSSLPTEQPLSLPLPPHSKKRPFDSISIDSIQSSSYFKMRAVLKDLRPHIIEVLRTPNFQDCKAAEEIRANVKILMDLYRQMITETTLVGEFNNVVPEDQAPMYETRDIQKDQTDRTLQSGFASYKLEDIEDDENDKLLVGGSAFGWNFIMCRPSSESKSTYYGMTKEAFRAKQEEWR